ncbi:hypothetical protein ACQ5SP_04680 [Rhodovulum sp. YNF3179]|uniref:hypothetical protein n=1 Tax=Rhodovulum sp. YNF3179 TaxID=3425127 RepID=UPI003D34AF0A
MLRRVYRQRRRILFGSALLVLAILTADRAQPGGLSILEGLGPLERLTLITLILGFTTSVNAFIVAASPTLRPVVECIGLAAFIQAALTLVLPDPLVALMWQTGYAAIGLFLLYVAIHLGLYGSFSDRIPAWFASNGRVAFPVKADPEKVWRTVVPDVGHERSHWSGTLESVDRDPQEPDTVHARFALGHGYYERQTITFFEKNAPWHCRYYFVCEASATNADFSEGVYDITLSGKPDGGTEVMIGLDRSEMHLRMALMMWFDDMIGDQADCIAARLNGTRDHSVTGQFHREVKRILEKTAAGPAPAGPARPSGA